MFDLQLIRARMRAVPFVPFNIVTKGGESFHVPVHFNCLILKDEILVGIPSERDKRIAVRSEYVSRDQIERLENVVPSEAAA